MTTHAPATIPPCILPLPFVQTKSGMGRDLSICWNQPFVTTQLLDCMQEANSRKRKKREYLSLVGDLECLGWLVRYTTLELDFLGHSLQVANDAISYFLPPIWIDVTSERFVFALPKILSHAHTKLLWNISPATRAVANNLKRGGGGHFYSNSGPLLGFVRISYAI